MTALTTTDISATSSQRTAQTSNTASAFDIIYSPSQTKVTIRVQSPEALQDKQFLYAVSENLALDKVVLVNCGDFVARDTSELSSLRLGIWSPGEYETTPSRKIATILLPDGESPKERTNTKFAADVWNTSRGCRGGEVDFTSKMLVLQIPTITGAPIPCLFVVMQRITDDADIPMFEVDNSDGGLLDAESDKDITFNPTTEPDGRGEVTLTATSGNELTADYGIEKLLALTYEDMRVTLAKDFCSTDGLTIVEGSDTSEDGLNANEVQIKYTILDETMQDLFTTLTSELLKREKSIIVVREDPFFLTPEQDYIVIDRGKSPNKVRITFSDFDDCDYNAAFFPLLQKLLEEGKTITLFLHSGEVNRKDIWKISSIIHELSDSGIEVELRMGINQKTEEPVYVLLPEKQS